MELPVCDVCGETVVATLCGTRPSSPESREAISAVGSLGDVFRQVLPRQFDGLEVEAVGFFGSAAMGDQRIFLPRPELAARKRAESVKRDHRGTIPNKSTRFDHSEFLSIIAAIAMQQ